MALTKRKVKGERRRRRWQNFRRRRRLLGFDDVPAVERPRLSTRPTPVAVAARGRRLERAAALRERVGGGRRELRCALSLSFDAASRRRAARGWARRPRPRAAGPQGRGRLRDAARLRRHAARRRGRAARRVADAPRGDGGDDGDLALAAGASEIRGCGIVYRARRHDGLLRCAHLVGEDEVAAADDLAPGLAPWGAVADKASRGGRPAGRHLELPPAGRSVSGRRPMLGAVVVEASRASGAEAWHLAPNLKPRLATEHVLVLEELRVKVEDRGRLEQALLNYVGFQQTKTAAGGQTVEKREKIVGRRLAVGLHNGRALTLRRTEPTGFTYVDLDRADGDVLAAAEGARVVLPGYCKHALRRRAPLQRAPVLSGGAAAPQTFRVPRAQGYVPFDGKRLRLRTGRDAKYVEVALAVDDTCREVSSHFVWPPPPDGGSAAAAASRGDFDAATLQRFAGGKLVGFDLSAAVYFTHQFYNLPPTRTERLRLLRAAADRGPWTAARSRRRTTPRLLARDWLGRPPSHAADDEPPLILKYAVDTSASMPNEGRAFAEYLASRRSRRLGRGLAAPRRHVLRALDKLLRQRSPVAKLAAEHAVVAPFGLVDEGSYGTMNENFATPASVGGRGGAAADAASAGVSGAVVGHVQIVCCNYGEEGKGSLTKKKADDERPLKDALGRSLDWRKAPLEPRRLEGPRDDLRRRPAAPAGPPRARAALESNPELGALLESRDRRGGLFAEARGRSARDGPAVSADSNAVTYDEVLMMVRRFRDDRGRVQYRGPLLSLLEAPNLKALEAQLIRVLTKAEAKGTTLERAFAYFDQDHGGTISVRFDENGDGVISLDEFLAFVRQRQREYKERKGLLERKPVANEAALLEARVKAIFLKAEELGVSVVDAFNEFDADGNGQLTVGEFGDALRSLGTFSDLKPGRSRPSSTTATDGNGTLELEELFALMGRDYADHLVLKLSRILDGVERKGTMIADCFAAWDADGGGSLSRGELTRGLRSLGIFNHMKPRDVEKLLDKLDDDKSGDIDIKEFYLFARLRRVAEAAHAVLRAAEAKHGRRARAAAPRDPAQRGGARHHSEAAFAEWDKDGGGTIDHAELKAGLKALGTFADMSGDGRDDQADVDKLVRYFDRDGDGSISHFDKDGDGSITRDELAEGLRELPGLEDITNAEAAALAKLYDANGDDEIQLDEFTRQLGASAAAGDAERLVLGAARGRAEAAGEATGRRALEDALQRRASRAGVLFEGLRGLGDAFADLTLADARRVVKALDADRSNSIDLTELRAFALAARNAKDEPDEDPKSPTGDGAQDKVGDLFLAFQDGGGDLRDAFARLDADGSGSIDAGELYEGLKGLGPVFDDLTRDDAKRLFRAKKTGGRPAAEKRGDRIDETAKTPAVLAGRASGAVEGRARAFDRDGSGKLSARELHKALKHVGGDDLFRDVTRKDVEALVRREFDDDGDAGGRHRRSSWRSRRPIDDAPRTPGGRRESAELRALSVKELLRGLRKLGVFQELDADDVEKLVRSDLDRDGNDAVELDEFLAFCRDARDRRESRRRRGRGPEIVSRNYEFSLDPDTRCVEKKLRRPRELAGSGGDARLLLDQYDVEGVGSVIRSDFVQVLMQLGLSLVDGGGPPRGDVDDAPTRADALRERQLAQLARVRGGGPGPANARRLLRTRQSRGDDDDARLVDEWDDLKMVEWYREGSKRDMRFTVDISAKERELRLVTSSEEAHLRRHVPAAFGTTGEGAVEADMIDASGPPGSPPVVLLMAHETIRVPFAFLTPSRRATSSAGAPKHRDRGEAKEESRTRPRTRRASCPCVLWPRRLRRRAAEVEARPRCVVDRTFRFYQSEGEILKRCVRAAAGAGAARQRGGRRRLGGRAGAADRDGRSMYVHCVSTGRGDASDVSIQWREAPDCPGAHEVLLKYARVGAFPSVGEFYVLVFRDRFCAKLAELWHCVVHSRLRADLNGVAGQAAGVELVELPIGKAITKRIPYRNPWNKPKSFALVSSDESILRPRDGAGKITIPPNGVDYLRLYFPAVQRRGMMHFYVNSEFDQSEEVFLLRLLVA
ncbi:Ca2-binding protein [Aureococcus anophagefferens]|nr:Ca2-binding protein [Aureococcus anophagefferens]